MNHPGAGSTIAGRRPAALAALLLAAAQVVPAAAQDTVVDPAGVAPPPAPGAPGPAGEEARLRPITLEEALREARDGNPELRRQAARTEGARAESRASTAPLLPSLGAETGWTRTSDPVGVFGTRLRQGTFGQEDFALDALNDPTPLEDWFTALRLRWSVASPQAWADRSAARRAAAAQAWREVRTREGTDLVTRVRFRQVQGRREAVDAARAAREAAEDTEALFRRRHEEGMMTRADVLQARAERERADAELMRARASLHEARVRLALHLGREPDRLPDPRGPLPDPEGGDGATGFDPARRADLRALAAAVDAAESRVTGARMGYLPALDAFAGWSLHGGDPFASDGTDWSVGVALRWELFTGFRRAAESARARAELTARRLDLREGLREARGEADVARRSVASARSALRASRAARDAAEEGRDLVRRRLEEGLATPTDLLQAEARANRARVEAVEALVRYHLAVARLEFALDASDSEEIR